MLPTLHIRLLGHFLVSAGDVPLETIKTPRLQELLAYLVLHREAAHSRPYLAFLLWPESTEAQAQTNLRKLVYQLRSAVPAADQFLYSDNRTLRWHAEALFTLDVIDFERAVAQANQAERDGQPAALQAALQVAADLYHGELLPSCYAEWVFSLREHLRQTFFGTLKRLILLLEETGEYPAAIIYAQRLLREDPLQEAIYRYLMRLHAANGDRAGALHTYHTCATVLQRELATEPSPATQALYERLLVQADIFKRILGGCQTIAEGLGALSNRLSDAHGKGRLPVRPNVRHATLAVNLAGSMATFLLETYEVQKTK